MAILGDASLWADYFPDDLIPDILDMVLDVWLSFVKPNPNDHEVHITKRFRASLEQYKDLKMLPIRIDREVPVDDLNQAVELGRIDLRLTHGYKSDVYFAFECKRLNVCSSKGKTSSLAKDYVVSGMIRFVGANPQYARYLTQGGMIGYVMNSNTKNAISAVHKQVKNEASLLQMKTITGLKASSLRPTKQLIRESVHHLPNQKFTIHHIFLPI
jgi:hypothetical protein